MSEKLFKNIRTELSNYLLQIEKDHADCVSLYAGSCLLCKKCNRPENKACRNIYEMRYSLESLGFDVNFIAQDAFNIDLKWANTSLPEYFTLISAILSKNKINPVSAYFESMSIKP